jgi:hypothetical protein
VGMKHQQTITGTPEAKCVDAVIRRSSVARRKGKGALHRASPRLHESTNIYISIGACAVVGTVESRLYVRRNHTKCNVNFVNTSRVVIVDQGRSSPPNCPPNCMPRPVRFDVAGLTRGGLKPSKSRFLRLDIAGVLAVLGVLGQAF